MRTTLRDHLLLLPAELPWLIRLRWLAGVAIIAGAVIHGAWVGWSDAHTIGVAIGLFVLTYNTVCWHLAGRASIREHSSRMLALAGAGVLLDLVMLTTLVAITGGAASPLLGLFILHIVLAMLLLPPAAGYGVAGVAAVLMIIGLWISKQLSPDQSSVLLILGWTAALMLTAFVTHHITARLRSQESHGRDQQSRLHAILDTAADGIITINERGIIQSANPAAASIFGYDVEELLGRNVSMLMPEPDHSRHDEYIGNYLRTGHAKIIGIGREILGKKKDSTIFPLELAVSEVKTDGTPGGRLFTGILRDISERKAAEDELRTAHDTLKRQQKALVQSEKMAAMGKMAAGVAHEIANPLASMDSILQLAQRRAGRDGKAQLSVESLREQVDRIDRIVRELTNFAHPDSAEWKVVPIGEIVQEALRMVRFERRLNEVTIHCDCADDAGKVRIIPQQMHQVIVNLVLNALDALGDVDQPRITITARCDEEWGHVEVSDNGHGIEPETLSRIFEPFFTTKPVGCGTGLGLSISYSIVQRHGGRLEVASTPGEGTTFTITLPTASRVVASDSPGGKNPDVERTGER
jgi:two-component system, LuxR family, sensor kinase FixL